MNITKVAAWSEIVSSVAILATLAYLAVQVQQNTAAIESQTRQAMLDGDMQLLLYTASNPEVVLNRASDEQLSAEQKVQLSSVMFRNMRSREFQFFQYRNGLLDEAAWQSYRQTILLWLGTKRTRNWWKQVGRVALDPGFVEMVDALIEDQPTDYYDRILALE